MRERPILFSAPMVRAILEGSKTQTRRVVKIGGELPPPWATFAKEGDTIAVNGTRPTGLFYWSEEQTPGQPLKKLRRWPISKKGIMAGSDFHAPCPYGVPGDRLWVKETHALLSGGGVVYRASAPDFDPTAADAVGGRWRPSIHMPRRASRLTLTITDVRVERLQDISEDDAQAEGLVPWSKDGNLTKYGVADPDGMPGSDYPGTWPWREWRISPVDAYQRLWESINGAGSWDANPWVWVVSFTSASADAGGE
jgi:hypothetical protein